jgi:hypothetical protein
MEKNQIGLWVTVLALSALLFLSGVGGAQEAPNQELSPMEQEEQETGRDFGYAVSSVFASMFYSPLKLTYAGLGLMTGGMGYVLTGGRGDVANNIIYPAIQGHYIITPNHLKGSEPVVFIGNPPSYEPQPEPSLEVPPSR